MGITIHYRGSIDDVDRIEDFEDRVLDLVLELGGEARIWRSADETDPSRMVRGLIVNLAPGQEATSLLLSPEGWLIGLIEIEDAETGKLTEPPYCSVKTQYGPIEGHVALVELLRAIKSEFIPNLEVMDEGEYWEKRDIADLRRKFAFLQCAIDTFAKALEKHPLTAEAAEDSGILVSRIERIAQLVHKTISRPSEHPPIEFPNDELGIPSDPVENAARWDAHYRENRRKQERMQRTIEERMLKGGSAEEAFDSALDEVVPPPIETDEPVERPWLDEAFEDESDERWQESKFSEIDAYEEYKRERHPLQSQAATLMLRIGEIEDNIKVPMPHLDAAMRSMGDVVGGLAQALPLAPEYEMDDVETGLSIVQLKRALRGVAFTLGSLFLVRADKQIDEDVFGELHRELDGMQVAIIDFLKDLRNLRQ